MHPRLCGVAAVVASSVVRLFVRQRRPVEVASQSTTVPTSPRGVSVIRAVFDDALPAQGRFSFSEAFSSSSRLFPRKSMSGIIVCGLKTTR